MEKVKINSKFVCCWGYDQTQYSIYNVVQVKGRFVLVEGLNSWSTFDAAELAPGSKVKIFTFKNWRQLRPAEQADWASRGFDWNSYDRHIREDAIAAAPVRTIVKVNRIDGESWTYIWQLDNGEEIRSDENYELDRGIKIIKAYKRCLVQNSTWNDLPYIRISQVISATLDPEFNKNNAAYERQNEYTAYNGR